MQIVLKDKGLSSKVYLVGMGNQDSWVLVLSAAINSFCELQLVPSFLCHSCSISKIGIIAAFRIIESHFAVIYAGIKQE